MGNHPQCALVDCTLHTLAVGILGQNVPNAYKRCIESAGTDVKGVQEPPCDSGGIGRMGNSLGSDLYYGKESTGWSAWWEASGIF